MHQRHKPSIVCRLDQMGHLVHQDVLKALRRLPGEIGVESDGPCRRIAAAPTRLHALDEDPADLDPDYGFPPGDQIGDGGPNLVAIPTVQNLLTACLVRAGPYLQYQATVLDLDRRRRFPLESLQQVASAPSFRNRPDQSAVP